MKTQRFLYALVAVNMVLLLVLLVQGRPVSAQSSAPVLRGRGLEIVDDQGRVRASITIEPKGTMNGKEYPETVLLRISDPNLRPVVKLTATEEGGALGIMEKGASAITRPAR